MVAASKSGGRGICPGDEVASDGSWFELLRQAIAFAASMEGEQAGQGMQVSSMVWELLSSLATFDSVVNQMNDSGVEWSDDGGASDLARIVYWLQILSAQIHPASEAEDAGQLLQVWRGDNTMVSADLCAFVSFIQGLPLRCEAASPAEHAVVLDAQVCALELLHGICMYIVEAALAPEQIERQVRTLNARRSFMSCTHGAFAHAAALGLLHCCAVLVRPLPGLLHPARLAG